MVERSFVFRLVTSLACGAVFDSTQKVLRGTNESSFWAFTAGAMVGDEIYDRFFTDKKKPSGSHTERYLANQSEQSERSLG